MPTDVRAALDGGHRGDRQGDGETRDVLVDLGDASPRNRADGGGRRVASRSALENEALDGRGRARGQGKGQGDDEDGPKNGSLGDTDSSSLHATSYS